MVGTLADLEQSYTVLECLLPDYLHGLVEMESKTDFHKRDKHADVAPLSSEARAEIKKMLINEFKLYDYVQKRLDKQYEECVSCKI